ncbi:MAG: TolC family protein [Elusimicrobiota bacterium]
MKIIAQGGSRGRVQVAGFAFFLVSFLNASEPIDLLYEDLPKWTKSGNLSIKSSQAHFIGSQRRTHHLARSFSPTVKLEAGYELFKTGLYETKTQPYGDLEARLNIFRGRRDLYEENIRFAQSESLAAIAAKNYRSELLAARKLFWDLVFSREVTKMMKEFVIQNEKNITASTSRINRGLTTDSDRLGFQMMDLRMKEEMESQHHETILIQADLAPLLGQSGGSVFNTIEAIAHAHDDHILNEVPSHESVPDLVGAHSNRQVAEWQRKTAASYWRPSIDLYGGYYLYTLRERESFQRKNRDDTAVGVKASLPLFDGFQSKNNAMSLEKQTEAYAFQVEYLEAKTKSILFVLKEELRHLDELVHSSEKQVEMGKTYLLQIMGEYNRGVKNAPDVLDALEKIVALKHEYAERRRDYKKTEAALLEVLGN